MLNSFRKLSNQNLEGSIRSFIFFILFYLYLWLEVDLRLIYHGGGVITNFPVFFRGWAFFQEFISYPGGPVEYLSAFLFQFFYIGWAGALVVTLQAWLICVCTDYFLKAINASHLRWVRFVPPILLLITYTRYTYHFTTTMALLAALLFVNIYLRVTQKSKLLCLVVFPVLSAILYAIAGGVYLLFAVLCTIYELLFRRRLQVGLLCLLSALIIPYIESIFVFEIGVVDVFSYLSPSSWRAFITTYQRMLIVICMLYLFLPSTAFGLGLWRTFFGGLASSNGPDLSVQSHNKAKQKTPKKSFSKFSKPVAAILSLYFRSNKLRWLVESLVLFMIAGATVLFAYDKRIKTTLAVDYYAAHKKWPQVLQAAQHHPNGYFVIPIVNRALYHTGRLNYDMFSYYQYPRALLQANDQSITAYWKRFDIYMDLGAISMAEHMLTDSLEVLGEHPITLKKLALINIIKGRIGAARIYLGALSKTLFYADWANNYLALLWSDPNLPTDNQIQRLRGLMMEKYDSSDYFPEKILLALLEKNKQNRMAFEYLMAWYLLTSQLDKFVQNLDKLDDFNYSEIPRHYEEAILVYMSTRKESVDLRGWQISPESRQRHKDFEQILNRYHRNRLLILRTLGEDYRKSYFFYHFFWGPMNK